MFCCDVGETGCEIDSSLDPHPQRCVNRMRITVAIRSW